MTNKNNRTPIGDRTPASAGARERATALMLICTFLLFGFNNANTSVMPEYFLYLGSGPLLAGAQNSICVLTAVILRFGFGPLADRIGSKPLMVVGALGFLVPCALIPNATSLEEVMALRMLQAVGLAAFHPNVARYLTATSTDAQRITKRISWSRIASTASLMVVPALLLPFAQAEDWTGFFLFMCLLGVLSFILLLVLPSERVPDRHHVIGRPNEGPWRTISRLCTTASGRRVLGAALMPALAAFGYSAILVFGPLYSESVQPEMNSGMILSAVSIGGLAGSFIAGHAPSRISGMQLSAALLGLIGIGLIGCSFGHISATLILLSGAVLGFGYFGAIAAVIAEVSTRAPKACSGTILSLQQSSLDIGLMVGSFCVGAALQAAIPMSGALVVIGCLMAAGALAWYMLCRT